MSLDQAGRRKEALVVLGAPRSGGAAVARLLSLAGAALPAQDADDAGASLHEPKAVAELNDRILADLGASWSDPFGPRDARARPPTLDGYVDEARQALRTSFGDEDFIVLKEPRVSLFVGLWKAALHQEGFDTRFIVVVRNPLEVAQSLRALHGLTRDRSLMMWATYMLAAEQGARGEKRLFLNFDELLADPEAVLEKIEAGLTMTLPQRSWDASLDIEQHIRPDQRRYFVGDRKITAPHLSGIEKLYDHFSAASRGQPRNIDVTDEVSDWLSMVEQSTGGLIKDEERRRKAVEAQVADLTDAAAKLGERERDLEFQVGVWTERARIADERSVDLEGEIAGAHAALDVLRRHQEAQLAELIRAHDARLDEAEAKAEAVAAALQRADVGLAEAEIRVRDGEASLTASETRLAASEARLAEVEQSHRSEMSALQDALAAAVQARSEAETRLADENARFTAEQARFNADHARFTAEQARLGAEQARFDAEQARFDAERSRFDSDLRQARSKAAADIAAADSRTEAAAADALAARDQSADLARELTAIIADSAQLRKYSAAELQLAVLRRLWPFR